MSKLTILIPLKDRPEFTLKFLENNILDNYNYLFADGSKYNDNYNIFLNYKKSNIIYKKFRVDMSCKDMINKINESINLVNSNYIMLADNDDFLNFHGIDKCLKILDKKKSIQLIGSNISFVKNKSLKENKYGIVYNYTNCKYLNLIEPRFSVFKMFQPYNYVYYSIFSMDVFKKVFADLKNFEIDHFQLFEILHSQFALMYTKYFHIKTNHYIRLENKKFSNDNYLKSNSLSLDKIYFKNKKIQNQINEVYEYIASNLNLNKIDLIKNFENNIKSSKKTKKTNIFFRVVIKIFYLLNLRFSINFIRTIYSKLFSLFF
tara:strand:+ start:21632 stop:22585 length:954 start_codon:yes stop_codon:yes gene_type:complete